MIVKVKSHKRPSFKALLNYMVHDKDRLFDDSGKSLCIKHNVKGNDIESWVNQFKENEKLRLRKRKDTVYCPHEILSWHRDDAGKVTLEKLDDMTREYIKLRNPKGMFIAIPHFDRDHYHMHICTSGIEYRTGHSMRLSKSAFGKLKLDIQKFQKERFPEFEKSVVNHGAKSKRRGKELENIKHDEKDKRYISAILKTCYKKANSVKSFESLIQDSGLITYRRGGRLSGLIFNERRYRLSKLGFDVQHLNFLERNTVRKSELGIIRRKGRTLHLEK